VAFALLWQATALSEGRKPSPPSIPPNWGKVLEFGEDMEKNLMESVRAPGGF